MARVDLAGRVRVVAVACVLAIAAGAAGCGGRIVHEEVQSPRLIAAGCPAVVPGTNGANQDFADLLVWKARTFISADLGLAPASPSPGPVRLGSKVGEVTCSLVDGPLSGVRERLANSPWPDGTATALPQGTAIYAVRDLPTECVLAARRDGRLVSYVAIDTTDMSWRPLC